MEEFLQSYGSLILFGIVFVTMFAMHGLGKGCGKHGHGRDAEAGQPPAANNLEPEKPKGRPSCH